MSLHILNFRTFQAFPPPQKKKKKTHIFLADKGFALPPPPPLAKNVSYFWMVPLKLIDILIPKLGLLNNGLEL